MSARFKVGVITGASAGIGRAAAIAFAKEGMEVALLSRNKDRLESLRAEIEALGRRAPRHSSGGEHAISPGPVWCSI